MLGYTGNYFLVCLHARMLLTHRQVDRRGKSILDRGVHDLFIHSSLLANEIAFYFVHLMK